MKVVWVTQEADLEMRPEGLHSDMASIRYRAIIPAKELAARGHQASVAGLTHDCFDSVLDQIADSDRVVFTKNYYEPECTERMLRELQARRVKTLFDLTDDRFHLQKGLHLLRMIAQADSVVTASPLLQELVKQRASKDSLIVSDPYEGPRGEARWSPHGSRLKALWFGHGSNLVSLRQALPSLLQAAKNNPIDLRIVTRDIDGVERECKEFNSKYRHALSLRFADWSIAETWNSLAAADFVVIPAQPGERWTLAKSPNRIIESLWAGRFVVAHPIPSYMEFKEWAWIGENLAEGIGWMVDNGPLIVDRIRSAQEYISSVYSPERIASEWEKVLEKA
jgi:glycosyltransferase involved in cell wall biosynthesis